MPRLTKGEKELLWLAIIQRQNRLYDDAKETASDSKYGMDNALSVILLKEREALDALSDKLGLDEITAEVDLKIAKWRAKNREAEKVVVDS